MGNKAAGREALVPQSSIGSFDTTSSRGSGTSMQQPSNGQSQIIYACIARSMPDSGKEVLCDYSALRNNVEAFVIDKLSKVTGEVVCESYLLDEKYGLHCLVEDSFWFVCLADIGCGKGPSSWPFQCLQSLRDSLRNQHPSGVACCLPPPGFADEMKKIVVHCNTTAAAKSDRVARMTENLDEVHKNLVDAIDKLMEKDEKIEELHNRSLVLSETSSDFRRGARVLHNTIRWRNIKSLIVMGLVLIVVIAIIVLMSCGGFSFKDC